jgi:hypothetical protein
VPTPEDAPPLAFPVTPPDDPDPEPLGPLPPSSELSFGLGFSVPSEPPGLDALLHPYPTALASTHIPT